MRAVRVSLALMMYLLMSTVAVAEQELKYFVVQGKPKPEVIKMMVDNPADPMPAARDLVASIPGAKLIDYYFAVGEAQNLAIIAVPDSKYAAAITYQRMGSTLMDEMVIFEVLPANKVPEMLGIAKSLNEKDAYLDK